ncbi:MAG: hypothetical protein DDT32_00911 [Syntrophomonadaceae bacterium]|nr:hypothetical protein [Bacillota bacterium]
MKSTNPLRYPGGKYFLVDYIDKVLEANRLYGCTFYEPYAGSAAVAIELLLSEKVENIVVVEKDPLIYAFWKSVVDHTAELCRRIEAIEVTLGTWYEMQKYKGIITPLEGSALDLGVAGLFLNRTNYSGILKANPLGGKSQSSDYKIDCRFNKQKIVGHIERISEKRTQFSVHWGDALAFLRTNRARLHESNSFVYIDPPYYEQGKSLYRFYYGNEDHQKLARTIERERFPWLISYDDHPFINQLYLKTAKQKLYCDYTAQKYKKGKELLISNLILPPIENHNTRTSESMN